MTTQSETKKDLVVLVPDLDTENAIRGLLARNESFGIRPLREYSDYEFQRATNHDNGCRSAAEVLLAPALNRFKKALVIFDREGCGRDSAPRETIESDVQHRLETAGWKNRCAVIVIDPELESWVWSLSPLVSQIIGWGNDREPLRNWMTKQGWIRFGSVKPDRPKEALKAVLNEVPRPWSARLFMNLAQRVSLRGCVDPSFGKLRTVLCQWFPRSPS